MTQQPAPLLEAGHAGTADGSALGLCGADVRIGRCDPESLGPHLSAVLRRNFLESVASSLDLDCSHLLPWVSG